MYNGVGLQTARGSGTSGYVQKNLSHITPGTQFKQQDYGQILKAMKENPLAPPKPPNQELLTHELKRKIEAQVFTFRKKLKADNPSITEEDLQLQIKDYRLKLSENEKSSVAIKTTNMHEQALAKENQMKKLKEAMNIGKSYEFGAAFDVELQERKRLDKLAERETLKKEEKRAKREQKKKAERQLLEQQLKEILPAGDSQLQILSQNKEKIKETKIEKESRDRKHRSSSSSSSRSRKRPSDRSRRHQSRRSRSRERVYHNSRQRSNSRDRVPACRYRSSSSSQNSFSSSNSSSSLD